MAKDTEEGDQREQALLSVARGAFLFFLGNFSSKILKFVFNLIMTNVLGASLFGIYSYATTIKRIVISLAQLGTGKALLKFIPSAKENPGRTNWVVSLAYITGAAGSLFFGVVLYVLAPIINGATLGEPLLTEVLRIFAIVIPFNTLLYLTNETFRGLEKLRYRVAMRDVIKPLVQIVLVSIAFLLGYSLVGAVVALAIGGILLFSLGIMLLETQTDVRLTGQKEPGSKTEFYNFSIPLMTKDIGRILYNRIDIIMVGVFLTGATVGIYRVSMLLATVIAVPLAAVNQLFPPVASDLYSNDRIDELESVYEITTRWIVSGIIPPILVLILYAPEILNLFGGEFSRGVTVLHLFVLAQLTNSAVGPSGFLLTMSGHQYLNMVNQLTLGILNTILNYFLILEFGFLGAALATAGTLILINIVRVVEVYHFEKITPYSSKFIKPILSAFLTLPVVFSLDFFFSGNILLLIGSVTSLAVFAVFLYVQGVEQEDKDFFRENVVSQIKD
jgi:O-antigen/teichoic acid export membrane protein